MEQRAFFTKVSMGVFRAVLITIVLLVVFSIIMTFKEVSTQFISVYYVVATCLSVVYGAIYSARKNNRNGWLVGILVAVLYMSLIYILSALLFKNFSFGTTELLRLLIAILVGALSGMLGINI
ncbi:MAG: TIGR04086 family membrane protein [Clostridiales bacterium]|uniref:TIGR04086 family membrane protein n=1 Tax=Clostridium sp. N3C TaxID=1776758 RepID=UPI00092E0442|nr:TIGR04086 family membrane protein [Clostridium sp. N3C]NLZ48549.1 TIGR04086 family membrane protein [Clostridiales bacterium]SCN21490.1 putative membrane protein [Clostridium sp. N3C]